MKLNHSSSAFALLAGASLIGLTAAPSLGAGAYQQLWPISQVNVNNWATSLSHNTTVVEGTTAYSLVVQATTPGNFVFTKTTGIGGALTTTTLADAASFTSDGATLAANNRVSSGFGAEIVGDYIQIPDGNSGNVYRVNKNTGQASIYIDRASIQSQLGLASLPTLSTSSGATNSGEAVFYDSATNNKLIVATNGAGVATVLVSATELANATPGGLAPSSGLEFDASNNLYFGATSTGLWRRTPAGVFNQILTPAQILAVLGGSNVGFNGDMFYAPDGRMYFRYGGSGNRGILSFDPANPVGTLTRVLSSAQLIAAPGAGDFTGPMTWANNNLAWTVVSSPFGFYAVPEPGALALLGMGAALLTRRRRA